jgi:hypothetical protein
MFALFTAAKNMTAPLPRFNLILAVFLLFAMGCRTSEEKLRSKHATNLRFHVETNPDGTRYNFPVQIYRNRPIKLQVQSEAALDEGHMERADLVAADEFGNFAIKITFDERGRRTLSEVTTINRGRRLVALCRWTESRPLAAPLITKTLQDGVLVFTPDATREEAERIVLGLNNVIAQLKKPYTF